MVIIRPRATPSPPAAPPKLALGEQPHVKNEIKTPFVRDDEHRLGKVINDSTMFSIVDLIYNIGLTFSIGCDLVLR